MEIFWTDDIAGGICTLGEEESAHCVRVLRHRTGDAVNIIDGCGTMYECVLTDDSPKCAQARIIAEHSGWGGHPYRLVMAVCPTKNIDRYEWFAEKATEVGLDRLCPVIGEHSERKVLRTDRIRKIFLSAAKQSLKSLIPECDEPCSAASFIRAAAGEDALKLIAYCFEDESVPRMSIRQAMASSDAGTVIILIGPEGDFSREEAKLAVESGFVPVHLGPSRLRTETAALTAVEALYYQYNM